ncbi:T9SS type B sorting domain-containing protein [Ascidiimonas sp. W6]|uniref:T9SS type B sorting domain-containing protein n=1 Tax=Ascidiimonas meishanensis TaxID=3128903 RepID=UPI0030ECF050
MFSNARKLAVITWSLFLIFVSIGTYSTAQSCTSVLSPANGAVNVPLDATITWTPVAGVTGYIISLGTTPGGSDIVSNRSVGLSTSFLPPLGLPNNTTIYVSISLFFFNNENIPCPVSSFTTENITTPPLCTDLTSPLAGAVNVAINANLQWNVSIGTEGYLLTIGTTPGGNEILPTTDVGNILSYNPLLDFPASTIIYVTVIPYNSNGSAINCNSQSFTTGSLGQAPECTNLISPLDGSIDVPLTPELRWSPVTNATGYIINMGSTPGGKDILNNFDAGNTTSTVVVNFLFNVTIFVTITPYNDAGLATGCDEESFSTSAGCGPYFDPNTGLIVDLNPVITDPDTIGLCSEAIPFNYVADTNADGYVWYGFDPNGDEVELTTTRSIDFEIEGTYRLVAYTIIDVSGEEYRCENSKLIEVITTEGPRFENIRIEPIGDLTRIIIETSGSGDYEYAINNPNGPYQDANFFDLADVGNITVYAREKSGCGLISRQLFFNPVSILFPKFFTPNSDTINDFWNILEDRVNDIPVTGLQIFDRYGKLLTRIRPQESGWDGTFNGRPMPASDYWFAAILENGEILKGHFALKR